MRAGDLQANAGAESGRKFDFAVAALLADGFRGVLDEIEKDLDELVAIGENRRQRGIVVLDKADVAGKPACAIFFT